MEHGRRPVVHATYPQPVNLADGGDGRVAAARDVARIVHQLRESNAPSTYWYRFAHSAIMSASSIG
jgi:hypothetical protein